MPSNPFQPEPAEITEIKTEAADVITLSMRFEDEETRNNYYFGPGQYNMLSLPGIGEAPLSISSSPDNRPTFDHTIRIVGRVTQSLAGLNVGDKLGVRGPYGRPWPIEELDGKRVAVIAGGTGIACIKPAISYLATHRDRVKSAAVLYGAKKPQELVFADQFDEWQQSGIDLHLTVDTGRQLDWPFHVGVVTTLFDRIQQIGPDSVAMISGPEIMMRFCVVDLLKRGFRPANIFLSLERRMDCAISMCGHCQLGPKYVCQDGPVFSYSEIENLFGAVA